MARKKKEVAAPAAVPAKAAAPKKALTIEERVSELEGDLARLAELLGKTFGEPLKGAALDIASKRQG
jgi:hypothetical protein